MNMKNEQCDLAIIGGGPAGYSAALYAARASLSTVVIEQGMPGGQIATSDMIDNYPGIPAISGAELGTKMQAHAEEAGARTEYLMVESLDRDEDGGFTIAGGDTRLKARSVIVATGATPRPAGFENEDVYRGRGISYCATCDAMFYRGKRVYVIGGGNSAVEEALFLARIASEVILIVRRDRFRASRGMVARLMACDNVSVRFNTSIVSVDGGQLLSHIDFRDTQTGEVVGEDHPEGSFGIFVFAGNDPVTGLVSELVDLAPDGGVETDEHMATRTPGLFCAGDMRSKSLRQVITAAADGAIAAVSAYRHLDE
ncbi:MAG: FAD-dependent oxidoreductase [Collinsella sp.]|nr:FAD-dependent oxidoreductase [Collinsella sp.]